MKFFNFFKETFFQITHIFLKKLKISLCPLTFNKNSIKFLSLKKKKNDFLRYFHRHLFLNIDDLNNY
jgi:hypothetical protein